MNIQDIMNRVQYENKFLYVKELNISGNTSSTSETIIIGNNDFLCNHLRIVAIDSAGTVMSNNGISRSDSGIDSFTIKIKDQNGHDYMNDPVNILAIGNEFYKGLPVEWFIERKLELTITIAGSGFPATAQLTYPVYFSVILDGYKLI